MDFKRLRGMNGPTNTQVGAPIIVDDPDAANWDASCDTLVVGLGLAGASAAMRSSELGQDTIVVERFTGGGASELSGGIVYAGGTHVQSELGVEDSPENMFRYLVQETGGLIREDVLRKFCDDSPGLIRWLEKYGVVFGGPLAPRKTSYPMRNDFLYVSGNELVPSYRATATPAARGHRAKPTYKSGEPYGGQFIMHAMKKAVFGAPNIRTFTHSTARRLIIDASGAVVGAEVWQIPAGSAAARKHARYYEMGKKLFFGLIGLVPWLWRKTAEIEDAHARPIRIRARKGVVLAAGGFMVNRPMVEQLAPDYRGVLPLGTMADDGSGIQLGISVGGTCSKLEHVSAWRFINPPYAWVKGIVVSPDGERYDNEELYGARLGKDICERGGGHGYLIVDAAIQSKATAEVKAGGMLGFQKYPVTFSFLTAPKAATIEVLARKVGMSPERLAGEVETYNRAIERGEPDPKGKSDENRSVIKTGPFYSIDLSWGQKFTPLMGLTMGGLDVDQDSGAVVNEQEREIGGLYAAGRSAVGIPSNRYISGLSLADCVWAGWRAAEGAATRSSQEKQREPLADRAG
ncbi:FAD-binding protein [soil metagenome]